MFRFFFFPGNKTAGPTGATLFMLISYVGQFVCEKKIYKKKYVYMHMKDF